MLRYLIDFYCSIDFPHEEIRGDETNRASENPECNADQESVTEVEHGWNEFRDVQLKEKIDFAEKWKTDQTIYFGEEVKDRINEDVDG